jgi:putative lipoprotein
MISRPATLPALLLLLLSMAGCTDRAPGAGNAAGDANRATLGGTVSYRERIALTNEAVLVVTLEDVSRQDAAAEVIASQRIADPGQVPIRFELAYPRDAIDQRMRLVARAHITDRGRLLFTTEEAIPVLTRGGDREAHLLLVPSP